MDLDIENSGSDAKLELGFGSPVELFVDSLITTIECNEASRTIGVAFEDDRLRRVDCKEET